MVAHPTPVGGIFGMGRKRPTHPTRAAVPHRICHIAVFQVLYPRSSAGGVVPFGRCGAAMRYPPPPLSPTRSRRGAHGEQRGDYLPEHLPCRPPSTNRPTAQSVRVERRARSDQFSVLARHMDNSSTQPIRGFELLTACAPRDACPGMPPGSTPPHPQLDI